MKRLIQGMRKLRGTFQLIVQDLPIKKMKKRRRFILFINICIILHLLVGEGQ